MKNFLFNISYTDRDQRVFGTFLKFVQTYYPELTIIGGEVDNQLGTEFGIQHAGPGSIIELNHDKLYDITWYKDNMECLTHAGRFAEETLTLTTLVDILKEVDKFAAAAYPEYARRKSIFEKSPEKFVSNFISNNSYQNYAVVWHLSNGWKLEYYEDGSMGVEVTNDKKIPAGNYVIFPAMDLTKKQHKHLAAIHAKVCSMTQHQEPITYITSK